MQIMLGPTDTGEYRWTQVMVADYLIPIDGSTYCQVCVRSTGLNDNTWYLGATWFSGYYVEFLRDSTQSTV